MRGLAAVPSVLGGVRPNVRDAAAMTVRRVQYLRAESVKLAQKLAKINSELAAEEGALADMRAQCGNCGTCSACTG